jgi:hypothetical protein
MLAIIIPTSKALFTLLPLLLVRANHSPPSNSERVRIRKLFGNINHLIHISSYRYICLQLRADRTRANLESCLEISIISFTFLQQVGHFIFFGQQQYFFWTHPLGDIYTSKMTNREDPSPIITIDSKSSASETADMMLPNNIRHLLVVDESYPHEPVGKIGTGVC